MNTASLFINSYTFLNSKYLLDNLYNNYLISGGLKLGYIISKLLDKGFIEFIGPFGLTEGSYSASRNLSKLDTGVITTYALYITLGLISILFILFSPNLVPYDSGVTTGVNEFQGLIRQSLDHVGEAINVNINGLTEGQIEAGPLSKMQSDYTFGIKLLLLSIFSIYFILSV